MSDLREAIRDDDWSGFVSKRPHLSDRVNAERVGSQ
jgi:hypothetical protein